MWRSAYKMMYVFWPKNLSAGNFFIKTKRNYQLEWVKPPLFSHKTKLKTFRSSEKSGWSPWLFKSHCLPVEMAVFICSVYHVSFACQTGKAQCGAFRFTPAHSRSHMSKSARAHSFGNEETCVGFQSAGTRETMRRDDAKPKKSPSTHTYL